MLLASITSGTEATGSETQTQARARRPCRGDGSESASGQPRVRLGLWNWSLGGFRLSGEERTQRLSVFRAPEVCTRGTFRGARWRCGAVADRHFDLRALLARLSPGLLILVVKLRLCEDESELFS
jgi:hypothetical protein